MPEPLVTVQVCSGAVGCVFTVTAYAWPALEQRGEEEEAVAVDEHVVAALVL